MPSDHRPDRRLVAKSSTRAVGSSHHHSADKKTDLAHFWILERLGCRYLLSNGFIFEWLDAGPSSGAALPLASRRDAPVRVGWVTIIAMLVERAEDRHVLYIPIRSNASLHDAPTAGTAGHLVWVSQPGLTLEMIRAAPLASSF